jgi:hypothetical protein
LFQERVSKVRQQVRTQRRPRRDADVRLEHESPWGGLDPDKDLAVLTDFLLEQSNGTGKTACLIMLFRGDLELRAKSGKSETYG